MSEKTQFFATVPADAEGHEVDAAMADVARSGITDAFRRSITVSAPMRWGEVLRCHRDGTYERLVQYRSVEV